MKLRLAFALVGLTACQSGGAADDVTVTADTSVPVETSPEHEVAPREPRKPARFVMVGPATDLRAAPSAEAAAVEVTEPAMVMAVDAQQPDNPTWVRLVQTPLRSRCGYPSLKITAAVYAERSSLLQTLTEDFVYEVPGKTEARVVLRAGVALLAREKDTPSGTDYEIAIVPPGGGNRVRATLPLRASDLPRVINGAQLTAALPGAIPKPAASTSAPPVPGAAPSGSAPKASFKAAAFRAPARMAVGKYVVRLPKTGRPHVHRAAGPTAGTDRITLKTGCLEVVGYAPSNVAYMPSRLGLLAALKASPPFPGGSAGLSGGFDADIGALMGAKGTMIGDGGLGTRGSGRGGGGRGEGRIGGLGRVDTGRGYGRGRLGGAQEPVKVRARVHIGSALIRGGLAATRVRRAILPRKGRFLACFEKGRRRTPDLSGRVLMELTVDSEGKVSTARAIPKSQSEPSGTDLPDPGVVSCVTRSLLGLSFTANGDGKATIRIPIRFSS